MELENLKKNMAECRTLCFEITNSRVLAWTKYFVTYVLFYLPEKFFMILFMITVRLFLRESTLTLFFRISLALSSIYKRIMDLSLNILNDYSVSNRNKSREEVIMKMWFHPLIPYHIIVKYADCKETERLNL